MAERARELLDLPTGLSTTVLVDNRTDHVAEFIVAGGRAIHYRPGGDRLDELATLVRAR